LIRFDPSNQLRLLRQLLDRRRVAGHDTVWNFAGRSLVSHLRSLRKATIAMRRVVGRRSGSLSRGPRSGKDQRWRNVDQFVEIDILRSSLNHHLTRSASVYLI
jgi:hypothetical protein